MRLPVNSKLAVIALALLTFTACGYFAPYLTVYSMKAAAERKDGAVFSRHIDYKLFRESLKEELLSAMVDAFAKHEGLGVGAGAAAEAQAEARVRESLAVSAAFVIPMVDTVVHPDYVMQVVANGGMPPFASMAEGRDLEAGGQRAPQAEVRWSFVRPDARTLVAYGAHTDAVQSRTGFIFKQSGFFSWRLTGIELPLAAS